MVPLPIPKIKTSTDFGHLILVVPYFQFFFFLFLVSHVMTGAPARPLVPLERLWYLPTLPPDKPTVGPDMT